MLKSIRTSQGYKQYEFAKVLGYEPSYLSALERGKKDPPKPDKLEKLIQRMNLTEEQAQKLRNAAEFTIYMDLIQAIDIAAAEQSKASNQQKAKLEKAKLSAEQYRLELEGALAREVSLLYELYEVKKQLAKFIGANILPLRP